MENTINKEALLASRNIEEYRNAGGVLHSGSNQNICRRLVEQHVGQCASYIVSAMVQYEPDSWHHLFQSDPDYLEAIEQHWEDIDWIEVAEDLDLDYDTVFIRGSDPDDPDVDMHPTMHNAKCAFIEEYSEDDDTLRETCDRYRIDYDDYRCEILEHWIVNTWFGEQLKKHGQVVEEDFHCLCIWGRATSGQAILLDYVISSIAAEMQILDGQKNDWGRP